MLTLNTSNIKNWLNLLGCGKIQAIFPGAMVE